MVILALPAVPVLLKDNNTRHYTNAQQDALDILEAEARDKFSPSTTKYYESINVLRCELREWSASRGAHLSSQGSRIECKRATAPRAYAKQKVSNRSNRSNRSIAVQQQRSTSTTRCGCEFVIKFSRASLVLCNAPVGSVRITEGSFYRHTNGCFPSQSQLIADKRRSGAYENEIQKEKMESIISILQHGRNVPCSIMRDMMRPLYPSSVTITAQMVTCMRLKVNRVLSLRRNNSVPLNDDPKSDGSSFLVTTN